MAKKKFFSRLRRNLDEEIKEREAGINAEPVISSQVKDEPVPEPEPSNENTPLIATSTSKVNFLMDDPSIMTNGRKIALYLSQFSWYNPHLNDDKEDAPSIAKGWAHFEHTVLARHKRLSEGASYDTLELAEPGEDGFETVMYSPLFTPLSQMGDFGMGVGLYFASLWAMIIMMLVAGLVSVPNILYFSSEEYSHGQEELPWHLKGSAICTEQAWVPCLDCTHEDFVGDPTRIQSVSGVDENGNATGEIMFALKNECNGATEEVGMNFVMTLFIVFLGLIVTSIYLDKIAVQFDEDEQRPQDYSIVVRNPPPDATDPEEWRNYFMDNFGMDGVHVTCCTVGVDNRPLLKLLVKRRETLKTLHEFLHFSGHSMETLKSSVDDDKPKGIAGFMVTRSYKKLLKLNEKILAKSQESYPAAAVFVTFERERGQRIALENMTVSRYDANNNNTDAVSDPKLLFRGEHVLFVEEPMEPSTIRWTDLNIPNSEHVKKFLSTAFIVVLLVINFSVVKYFHERNVRVAAYAISISNALIPLIAEISAEFEKYANEGRRQAWAYVKMGIFRCVNTVIPFLLIIPFTSRIGSGPEDVIDGVYELIFAETITENLKGLLDLSGNFRRHVLAPRSRSQQTMNIRMGGKAIHLSERYTTTTKLVFFAVCYCSIYPRILFLCAASLFANFCTDKFCLLRNWRLESKLGPSMAKFTVHLAFPIIMMAMAVFSIHTWNSLPFDSLCPVADSTAIPAGTYEFEETEYDVESSTVTVTADTQKYAFCERNDEAALSAEKEMIYEKLQHYGFFFIGASGLYLIGQVVLSVKNFYSANYDHNGVTNPTPFSEVEARAAYIPQVTSKKLAYPLVACSVEEIKDNELFEWENPNRARIEYDLTKDVEKIFSENGKTMDPKVILFGKLIHYPPTE